MSKYEKLDLFRIMKAIWTRHPSEPSCMVKMIYDRTAAVKQVSRAMVVTGERLIRVLQPDYLRRGMAAKRLARYRDGMLVSELIEAFEAEKDTRGAALRDIRYNVKAGVIKVYD